MDENGNRERVHVIAKDVFALANYDVDRLFELAIHDDGTRRAERWLAENGLAGKVRIGVVGVRDADEGVNAFAKVVVPGAGSFTHQEPYNQFPSDHFKTKVMMVTGGA